MKKDYPSINYCNAVAYVINCDNLLLPFTDKVFTGDMVWRSNSHGELFGVMQAMQLISIVTQHSQDSVLDKILIDIVRNNTKVIPDKKHASGLGLKCMTYLYKMPDSFNTFVDSILK